MSLDASLKAANALVRHRNVLTRDERLKKLKEEEKWQEGRNGILGLPKVAHRKMAVGGKGGAKEEAAEGATAVAGAPAAKGAAAPAAKGAAPAAKGAAAPAAKGAAAPAAKKK